MSNKKPAVVLVLTCLTASFINSSLANDWPQWRGANRDGKAVGFKAPGTWPNELTEKWKVDVGEGVATPALVGGKLYVFSRQEGNEILRCLDAATGKELWQDRYEALGASGAARSFSGPRSSPTVADGKVVTVGVRGMISCLDASSGKVLWRKDDFNAYPRFHPSCSPIIVDGLCIAQLGGDGNGAIVAYDLSTGAEKWKWVGDNPSYASPALMTISGTKLVVAQTEGRIVVVNAATGKLAWAGDPPAQSSGRGRRGGGGRYKAATPIIDGQVIISAGSESKAVKLEKTGTSFAIRELWTNAEGSVQFNSPVLKDGFIYGLNPGNKLFCINEENGETAWKAPLMKSSENDQEGSGRRRRGGGYGSIVDAGSVLMALTPSAELVVFKPSTKSFEEVARVKVASSPTHAHPVVTDNRVFVKDQNSVALLTVD